MTWTSPPTVATGDIYTAAMFNTYTRDNTNHLRTLTGGADPGASNKTLISSGASAAVWGTVPDAAMTNQKVNQVNPNLNPGGTFAAALSYYSGFIQIGNPAGVADAPVPAEADWYLIQDRYPNPGIDYRLQIASYILDPNDLYVRGIIAGAPTSWFKIWTASNDGSGSGLDADTVDGLNPGNSSGNIAVANGTLVTNLNAQLHAGLAAGNASGNIPISNGVLCTNLNAQLLQGVVPGNASGNVALNNGTKNVNCNVDQLDGFDWFTPITVNALGGFNAVGTSYATIIGLTHTAARTGTYLILWSLDWRITGGITGYTNQKSKARRTGSGTADSRENYGQNGGSGPAFGYGTLQVQAGDTISIQATDPTAATSVPQIDGGGSFMIVIWIGN